MQAIWGEKKAVTSVAILIALLLLLSPLTNHRYAAKWRFWIWAIITLWLIPISGFPSENGEKVPQTQHLSGQTADFR